MSEWTPPQPPRPDDPRPAPGAPEGHVPPPLPMQAVGGPPATGAGAWFWGLGLLLCVPLLNNLLVVVGALGYRSSVRRFLSPVGEEVVRRALSWHLTQLVYTAALLALHVGLLLTFAREGSVSFYPLGIPMTLVALLWIYGLVLSIVAGNRAQRGILTRTVGAIPFVRAR